MTERGFFIFWLKRLFLAVELKKRLSLRAYSNQKLILSAMFYPIKPFVGSFCLCFSIFLLLQSTAFAQRSYDLHWIGFVDKANSNYSLFKPQEYLSARALERRARYHIRIDSSDLPVSSEYVKKIAACGVKIHASSRWMNGVLAVCSNETADSIRKGFSFVRETRPVGFARSPQRPLPKENIFPDADFRKNSDYYGNGSNQIKMLNAQYVHQFGFRGAGLWVAVFDGGFIDFRETPAFDSMQLKGQLLGTFDFVEGDNFVYESSDHGRDVLSTMAANVPYLFVGTAPDAQYFLFKTEDEEGEYTSEEYYWLAAAELADSLGIDAINSSLGYYAFDDRKMSYAYSDFDGNTAVITKAADWAAKKGMLIITSAGNEGSEKWKYITAPADADSILSVAAVDRDGFRSSFSSYGFKNRKDFRPNLAARGSQAIVASKGRFDTKYNTGTSFAAPILAGAAISLWQSCPHLSNMELIYAMQNSASKASEPNNEIGYGIPNLLKSFQGIHNSILEISSSQKDINWVKNQSLARLDLLLNTQQNAEVGIELYNDLGVLLFEQKITCKRGENTYCRVANWVDLPNGNYYLYAKFGKTTKRFYLLR